MTLYMVIQKPKRKYREDFVSSVMILEADSAAAALRKAQEISNDFKFDAYEMFYRPYAYKLELSVVYYV